MTRTIPQLLSSETSLQSACPSQTQSLGIQPWLAQRNSFVLHVSFAMRHYINLLQVTRYLPHRASVSSEPSTQSGAPSQIQDSLIQRPLEQVNSCPSQVPIYQKRDVHLYHESKITD